MDSSHDSLTSPTDSTRSESQCRGSREPCNTSTHCSDCNDAPCGRLFSLRNTSTSSVTRRDAPMMSDELNWRDHVARAAAADIGLAEDEETIWIAFNTAYGSDALVRIGPASTSDAVNPVCRAHST